MVGESVQAWTVLELAVSVGRSLFTKTLKETGKHVQKTIPLYTREIHHHKREISHKVRDLALKHQKSNHKAFARTSSS